MVATETSEPIAATDIKPEPSRADHIRNAIREAKRRGITAKTNAQTDEIPENANDEEIDALADAEAELEEKPQSSIKFKTVPGTGISYTAFIPAFQLLSEYISDKWGEVCRLRDAEITNWAVAVANAFRHIPISVEYKGPFADLLALGMVSFQIMYPRVAYRRAVVKAERNGNQPPQPHEVRNAQPHTTASGPNGTPSDATYATGPISDFIGHNPETG